MAFTKRRTALAVRRPVTASPKYIALANRVQNLRKRGTHAARANEGTLLVLAGAAAPALIARMMGKPLPTFGAIDPGLLYGGAMIAIGMSMKGKTGERLKQLGTGAAAPAVARAIQTGTVKVSGDDDVGADDEIGGDDDVAPTIRSPPCFFHRNLPVWGALTRAAPPFPSLFRRNEHEADMYTGGNGDRRSEIGAMARAGQTGGNIQRIMAAFPSELWRPRPSSLR
jgi:hypothetical protein